MDSKSAEAYLTQNVEIFYEIPVKSGFFAKRAVKFDTFSLENSGPSDYLKNFVWPSFLGSPTVIGHWIPFVIYWLLRKKT